MNYSINILGKSIENLTKQDLVDFFADDKIETSTLEFKSGETEPEKLYKEIVGFLNCEGGLLILGAPKEKSIDEKSKFKTCQGGLTAVTKFKNPDSISHKINSNINEIPIGIKVQPIHLQNDDFMYVIEVPKSTIPPHQASNNGVYYIRIGGDSLPAPHGIVQSLFNRRQKPNLKIFISAKTPVLGGRMNNPFELQTTLRNKSDITADNPHVLLKFHDIVSYQKSNQAMAINYKEEPKFTVKHNWDTPLVDGLQIGFKMNVDSSWDYLVIEGCYWCRNTKLKKTFFLLGRQDGEIVNHDVIEGTGNLSDDAKIVADLMQKGITIYEETQE